MATLTGLYISQSYGGVIHLSTNTSIVTGSFTQLQDGFGTNLGVWWNGQGAVSGSSFTGSLFGTASSAVSATNGFPYTGSAKITGSLGVTGSISVTNGVEVKAGDLDFSGGNINIYSGNINQFAGASTLQTTVISGSLTLKQGATGSLLGTASFATSASYALTATSASYALNATSASYALNATSASYAVSASLAANSILLNGTASSVFATTGSNTFVGNQTISGSVKGNVNALTISSQTASLDCNTGNYFTLTLVSGSITRLNFSNTQAGQVINLQVQQSATSGGNLSFPSTVTFPTGSAYTASIAANEIDLLTFISFNGTNIRAVPAKQFQ